MLSNQDITKILAEISCGSIEIVLCFDSERPYLQARCEKGIDTATGEETSWTGRKWMLSPHMVKSEVVRTAYKAYVAAVLHEADEVFRYRGVPIYSPHYDVDNLVEAFQEDARSNGMMGV
jgi:hypothetical protein